jgi:Arc/MetJ-type ribon-helix-helix transcriptional regulator
MTTTKVAVSIDAELLREVDDWVARGDFPSRSRAVQAGLSRLQNERAQRGSMLAELSKLDPEEERSLTDEWLEGEAHWSDD